MPKNYINRYNFFSIDISYLKEFMGEESTIEKLFKNMDKVKKERK